MTNRPVEPANDPSVDPVASEQVPPNPETDSEGRPEPELEQPAEVESGDVAQDPVDPAEEPGVDPPVEDSGEPVRDPTQVAETEEAEEPAGH